MERPTSSPKVHLQLLVIPFYLLSMTAITYAEPEHVCDSAPVLDIGSRRQVFIDGRYLAQSQDVDLYVHQPTKTGEFTIQPDNPWETGGIGPYSCVLHDGKTYHMWYHTMTTVQWHTGPHSGAMCYARSDDGIHWDKPALGLVEFAGSKKNNIVFGHGAAGVKMGQDGGMVFIDPNAPEDQKFRLVIRLADVGDGVHIFSSPDGIHWKLTHRFVLTARPQERGHHLDCQNVIFWDNRINKYVAYGRRNIFGAGRSVFRGEADRLDGFPVVQDMPVVITPDGLDLFHDQIHVVDYYLSVAVKYPWADSAYYMFPTAYYHYVWGALAEFKDKVPTNAGPLHTQFAASRDGIHWQRYGRRPFVDLGMKGEFDWASARTIRGIVPGANGRKMYMYYRGSDWLHGWDRNEQNKQLLTKAGLGASQNIAVLSRLVLRRDGFVSVRAAYTGGEFTTPVLKFEGRKLFLNIDTSATGIVRIEILDADGTPVDGYHLEDCDRIHTANQINRVVTWGGRDDVHQLAEKSVRLRFVMRDADLYAFQFGD